MLLTARPTTFPVAMAATSPKNELLLLSVCGAVCGAEDRTGAGVVGAVAIVPGGFDLTGSTCAGAGRVAIGVSGCLVLVAE